MCGVAGIWKPRVGGLPLRERLARMSARLTHRGPDDDGIHVDSDIGLAHRRLSIIDLAGGHQPMLACDGELVLSYNGEIFNYLELRQELAAMGWPFRSQSDTEVLLAAYHCFGMDFLRRLNGQFAFALWDGRQRQLLLARDHAGIHPLFFCRQGSEVLFASEIKALMPVLDHALQPDLAAIDQIFTFWCPLPGVSGFAGIEQVRPGECLVFDDDGETRHAFFDWAFPAAGQERVASANQLAEELRDTLEQAVRLRLRADVPVGCYLSGGLDSSAITALVAHLGISPQTFSVNFTDPAVDEGQWQELLHRHLDVRHHALPVNDADIAASLPRAVWHAERPLLRTAPVPMLMLSQNVRSHGVKVVLTGEGADEVFAGYDLFREHKVRRFWARRPDSAWRWSLLRRLYPWMDMASVNYLKHFFGEDLEQASSLLFSHFPRWRHATQGKQFYAPAMKALSADAAVQSLTAMLPAQMPQWAPGHQAQYLESRLLMDGYLLSSQGDRMLMANSVEGRFPFLDPDLIRFANCLAPHMKMAGLNEKSLLKKAVADLLPASTVQRAKQPYRAPDASSLASLPYVDEVLSEHSIRRAGYFDAAKVALLRRKASSGRLVAPRDQMAWTGIVTTQLWHEQFIEGNVGLLNVAA